MTLLLATLTTKITLLSSSTLNIKTFNQRLTIKIALLFERAPGLVPHVDVSVLLVKPWTRFQSVMRFTDRISSGRCKPLPRIQSRQFLPLEPFFPVAGSSRTRSSHCNTPCTLLQRSAVVLCHHGTMLNPWPYTGFSRIAARALPACILHT